jgi:predicted HTH transcriptional regulator
MIQIPFDQITKQHIEELIANAVPESRTLDYKEKLHSKTNEDKKEFLADISSFANTSGGDILYGISEKNGVPHEALGLEERDIDAVILSLHGTIQQSIDPRVPNIQMQKIEGFPLGSILHIRIPKSWMAPHMVTFQGASRFYARNSGGKYQLDVREIKSAFLQSG